VKLEAIINITRIEVVIIQIAVKEAEAKIVCQSQSKSW
jgi:hypothetical protein